MNNKVPKRHVVVVIMILIIILLSLLHTWYSIYKFLYNKYEEHINKDETVTAISYEVNPELPEDGIYYNKEENKCIIIYSLVEPSTVGTVTGYHIAENNFKSNKYCKIIDFDRHIDYFEDYVLIAANNPSMCYYIRMTDYNINRSKNGINLILTSDDGTEISSLEYEKIK